MQFRTELHIDPSKNRIAHADKTLLIGSCFSQNIGQKLSSFKFNTLINPFGTIYNPVSIHKVLSYATQNYKVQAEDLICERGMYVHPDFHSSFVDVDSRLAVVNINESIATTHNYLQQTDHVFITLGTAIVYRYLPTNDIVANCHKIPNHQFEKYFLSVQEIKISLLAIKETLLAINKNMHIVWTVSPVRHIKDGIVPNNRSKARLIEGIAQLIDDGEEISYFPAYEWMMDDLRDYRFYEEDMIHPNKVAIDYIWNKFSGHYFNESTALLNKSIQKIISASHHRPFQPDSPEHQLFRNNVVEDIHTLKSSHDYLDFDEELSILGAPPTT